MIQQELASTYASMRSHLSGAIGSREKAVLDQGLKGDWYDCSEFGRELTAALEADKPAPPFGPSDIQDLERRLKLLEQNQPRVSKVGVLALALVVLLVPLLSVFAWYQAHQHSDQIAMLESRIREQEKEQQKSASALSSELDVRLGQAQKEQSNQIAQLSSRLQEEKQAQKSEELGTMKPWFSTKLPHGWVWADGHELFPEADWVPPLLRNKPVPNMDGYLLGGTKDLDKVGNEWNQGALKIPTRSLKGSEINLSTPVNKGVTQSNEIFMLSILGGRDGPERKGRGLPELWEVNDRKTGTCGYSLVEAKILQAAPGSTPLSGELKLPEYIINFNSAQTNPRHVMCRWIIYIGKQ